MLMDSLYAELQLKYYSAIGSAVDTAAALTTLSEAGVTANAVDSGSASDGGGGGMGMGSPAHMLQYARARYPFAAAANDQTGLRAASAFVEFDDAMARNDLSTARRIAADDIFPLMAAASGNASGSGSGGGGNSEAASSHPMYQHQPNHMYLNALFTAIRLKACTGQFDVALREALEVVRMCGDSASGSGASGAVTTIRVLLFIVSVYQHPSVSQPLCALPHICHALSLSRMLGYYTLHSEARLRLAQLHITIRTASTGTLSLSLPPALPPTSNAETSPAVEAECEISPYSIALDSISPFVSSILENCSATVQVETYLLLAKCILLLPATAGSAGAVSRAGGPPQALKYLTAALQCTYRTHIICRLRSVLMH